jgi:uridine phosphorylase
MKPISHTDLILNPDGSVYHLNLLPEDLAEHIILVGDPGRVARISACFDELELKKQNREFVTHTGRYKGKRITALSTGIGTDNIDIVLNELDALVNVDLKKRIPKPVHTSLNLIRIGTSGALQPGLNPGTRILTRIAGGFDGLYHFYRDPAGHNLKDLSASFMKHTDWGTDLSKPYFIKGSERLYSLLSEQGTESGITISTPGFYAPQFRAIRLDPYDTELLSRIGSFRYEGLLVQNFEMESSALYALAALLDHQAVTVCVAIANRITLEFLEDYHSAVDGLIAHVLEKLTEND